MLLHLRSLLSNLSLAPLRVWRSSLICAHVRTHVHTPLVGAIDYSYFYVSIIPFYVITLCCDSVCPFIRRYRVRILGNVLLQYGYIGLGLQWANDHPPAHLTTSSYINSSSVHKLSPSLGLRWLGLAWLTRLASNRYLLQRLNRLTMHFTKSNIILLSCLPSPSISQPMAFHNHAGCFFPQTQTQALSQTPCM